MSGRARTKAPKTDTVRKNFNLPQSALDRARKALGTRTETETVIRALEAAADLEVFRAATNAALEQLGGKGGFENPFD